MLGCSGWLLGRAFCVVSWLLILASFPLFQKLHDLKYLCICFNSNFAANIKLSDTVNIASDFFFFFYFYVLYNKNIRIWLVLLISMDQFKLISELIHNSKWPLHSMRMHKINSNIYLLYIYWSILMYENAKMFFCIVILVYKGPK